MRVLFVRFSAIGDIVLTTGPIAFFHKKFPNAEIDVLTSPVGEEIIKTLPFVRNIYKVPKGSSLGQILPIYKNLDNYDYIFDWQGNLKSFLVRWMTKGRYLKLNKHSRERRAFVKSRKSAQYLKEHVVEKYSKVFLDEFNLPVPLREELRPTFPGFKDQTPLNISHEKYVVLHPYASQKNKEWPYFKELSQKLLSEGLNVVVVGNGSSQWPDSVVNVSNQTNLNQLFGIIEKSTAIITTDSGPMHIGIAFNKPTLALFGPTTTELGFYPDFKNTKVIEDNNLDCRPCHIHGGNECPLQHFNCMKNLSPQKVFEAFSSLLGNS